MNGLLRVLAAVAGGLLLSVLVAPYEIAWLHWGAYLPAFWMLRADKPRANAGLLLLYGTVAEAAIFSWIAETITLFSNIPAPAAWAILVLFALVYGLPYLITFAFLHPMRRRLGDLWIVALPAWLVIVEWLSTWLILFPYQQGVSQYRTPWVWQIVSVTGVWGVSYLMLFFNACFGEWIYRRRQGRPAPVRWMVTAVATLACVVAFGAWRHPRIEAQLAQAPVLDVLQVQSDRDMVWRMSRPSSEAFQFWVEKTAAVTPGSADLVVWPEGAVPYQLNSSTAITLLWDLVERGDFDLLVGAGTREREPDPEVGEDKVRIFNSTYFLARDQLDVGEVAEPGAVFDALAATGCDPSSQRVHTPYEALAVAVAGEERGGDPACIERLRDHGRALADGMEVSTRFLHRMVASPGLWSSFRTQTDSFGVPPVERSFGQRRDLTWWQLRDATCTDDDCAFVVVRCAGGSGCDVFPSAPHYDKMVPLPFGEYLPFAETFPWLGDLIEGPGNFRAGTEPLVFDGADVRFATPICYEAILGYVCDRFASPDLLVNVTNDAWFGDTAASALHGMLAAVRATELGLPIFRSAYSGVSFVVEPHGDIHHEAPLFEEVSRVVPVRIATVDTVYRQLGDWFVGLCAILLLALAVRAGWVSTPPGDPRPDLAPRA